MAQFLDWQITNGHPRPQIYAVKNAGAHHEQWLAVL